MPEDRAPGRVMLGRNGDLPPTREGGRTPPGLGGSSTGQNQYDSRITTGRVSPARRTVRVRYPPQWSCQQQLANQCRSTYQRQSPRVRGTKLHPAATSGFWLGGPRRQGEVQVVAGTLRPPPPINAEEKPQSRPLHVEGVCGDVGRGRGRLGLGA